METAVVVGKPHRSSRRFPLPNDHHMPESDRHDPETVEPSHHGRRAHRIPCYASRRLPHGLRVSASHNLPQEREHLWRREQGAAAHIRSVTERLGLSLDPGRESHPGHFGRRSVIRLEDLRALLTLPGSRLAPPHGAGTSRSSEHDGRSQRDEQSWPNSRRCPRAHRTVSPSCEHHNEYRPSAQRPEISEASRSFRSRLPRSCHGRRTRCHRHVNDDDPQPRYTSGLPE